MTLAERGGHGSNLRGFGGCAQGKGI
jgi:hypothetical protein